MAFTSNLQCAMAAAVKKLSEEVITDQNIKKAFRKEAGLRLNDSVLLQLTRKVQDSFIQSTLEDLNDLVQNDEVQENLAVLEELIESVPDKHKKQGWRPTGEPEIDSFGQSRGVLLAYENRLSDLRNSLLEKLEEQKEKLKNLRKEIEQHSDLVGDALRMPLPSI